MTAMISTSIARIDADGAGRDTAVEPDQQHGGQSGDDAGQQPGEDLVRGDW